MKKEDLFLILDAENFTREMAEEYFLHKAKLNVPVTAVPTPCSIAYISEERKLEVLPYLDLKKIDKVWGIKIGDIVFEKDEDDPCPYSKAKLSRRLKQVKNVDKILPYSQDYVCLKKYIDEFNETINILQLNGVSAAYLSSGDYWVADDEGESVLVSCPKSKFIDHRENVSAHVRWIIRYEH